ncbi:cysteine desulfurase family protein [Spongiimicrobium salis]|uniref:cysteine desulfurase family protein n=1 Tax=Spongiimicrobium salis TaxID=1667022 RepID=UPI00374D741D
MYSQIYLDYNATTPCAQEVVEAMLPYFHEDFGNPSSSHHPYGWLAKDAIGKASATIAATLGIAASDIIYTSGATESINMILKGICSAHKQQGKHLITSKAEHKAVLDTCAFLEEEGFEVTYLDVDAQGLISPKAFKDALRPDTVLAAFLYANNETGAVQPLGEIATLAKANNTFLFADATQALGKIPLASFFEAVDFCCFSAHKVYGPKGMGMVYIKNLEGRGALSSFIQGGGQQKGMRGGTLNTPGIVGFAKAIQLAYANFDQEIQHLTQLRNQLEEGLLALEHSTSNSTAVARLPNTANISFAYVDGETLLRSLSKFMAVSNGSACNSAAVEPSHVLSAMGVKKNLAYASLRLSLGRYTKEDDIKRAITIISKEVQALREDNILWERRQQ